VEEYATGHRVDLRATELDVASQESAESAIRKIVEENGRLDVIVHNAGHMVFGPAEAFTPEQFAELYDVNVLSTQRVKPAALPQLRKQGRGLLLWVSSSSVAGGTPPYLSPYFAAKAGMDALAVLYARELTLWGIETSIIVPGAFTKGTNHFAHASVPADKDRLAQYEAGPYKGYGKKIQEAFAAIRARGRGGWRGRGSHREGCRCALRQAPVPRAHARAFHGRRHLPLPGPSRRRESPGWGIASERRGKSRVEAGN
jgi:NAD(P)-dependent dehydrogenase (short-subunit alcohol dehydrogenase family)